MRKRIKVLDDYLSVEEPLDEEEQAEIVALMETEAVPLSIQQHATVNSFHK